MSEIRWSSEWSQTASFPVLQYRPADSVDNMLCEVALVEKMPVQVRTRSTGENGRRLGGEAATAAASGGGRAQLSPLRPTRPVVFRPARPQDSRSDHPADLRLTLPRGGGASSEMIANRTDCTYSSVREPDLPDRDVRADPSRPRARGQGRSSSGSSGLDPCPWPACPTVDEVDGKIRRAGARVAQETAGRRLALL